MKNAGYMILGTFFGISYAILVHLLFLDRWLGILGIIILAIILSTALGSLFICISNKKIVFVVIVCCTLGFPSLIYFGLLKGVDELVVIMEKTDVTFAKLKKTKLEMEKAKLEMEKSFVTLGCRDAESGKEPYPYISEGYLKGYAACDNKVVK